MKSIQYEYDEETHTLRTRCEHFPLMVSSVHCGNCHYFRGVDGERSRSIFCGYYKSKKMFAIALSVSIVALLILLHLS